MSSNIHNIQIEQAVLAALMTVANSLETVSQDISGNTFFSDRHKMIYQAIQNLAEKGQPYDAVLVEQQLISSKKIELCGGTEYLIQLMNEAPSTYYNIENYVAELNKLHTHRQLEEIGQRITAVSQDLTCPDAFLEAENILGSCDDNGKKEPTCFDFENAMDRAVERMIAKTKAIANGTVMGVQFSIPQLDALLGTIETGHFCVIGGRPGSGKSTLAQMLMLNVAKNLKKGVLFVSAEMDVETLANRCMSSLARIPYNILHNGEIVDGIYQALVAAQSQYRNLPIQIETKQKPTIAEVRSYARKAKRRFKELGCIIVDYIGLVRDPSKKDRVQEVSSISRDLKAMAKEFDCPVIALAQLNRESEKNKRPVASDLKDSGQIEQDADQIIMVHPTVGKDMELTGVTELVIAKNRHGKKGVVPVREYLEICRFVGIGPHEMEGAA